jgi:hypothetical protein
MASLKHKELKLPVIPIPKINSNDNPKDIVSRRIYYLRYVHADHKVLNSIRVEKQVYSDGKVWWEDKSFKIFHTKKVKARTPEELLQIQGIRYLPETVRLVRE